MFEWFRRRASTRLKLKVVFGLLNSLLVVAVGLAAGECARSSFIADAHALDLIQGALRDSNTTFLTVSVAAFCLSVFLGGAGSRVVAAPIEDSVARLEDLAGGELDAPIVFADREDEVGRMARAMLALQASAKTVRQLQQDLTDQRRQNSVLVDAISAVHAARRPAPSERVARSLPPLGGEPRLVVDNRPEERLGWESEREEALLGLLALLGRTRRP
jgi:methyl-accepting chemotaxis protein